ncbi:MAG: hypothetical protein ACNI25_07060 [Halarcobacter sp.]
MNKKYSIVIVICFLIFWFVKLLDSTGTIDTIKLAMNDKFNYKIETLLTQADDEDMVKILNSFMKKVQKDYANKTTSETVLLSANQKNKHVVYKFQMNYDDLLQSVPNKRKLSNKIKNLVYKDICSQGILSFIVENKAVSFEYIYYDSLSKEQNRYLIQSDDCKIWEDNNLVFSLTKKAKNFINSL